MKKALKRDNSIRRCKGCTRLFEPKDRKQRYHSLRCGNAARQRKRQARLIAALKLMGGGKP